MGRSKKVVAETTKNKSAEIINVKAYDVLTKKGSAAICITLPDGNTLLVEKANRVKYGVYTGVAYTSKEHNAYIIKKGDE